MAKDRRIVGARITGRVQGVGFRAWTHGEAERHGLAGWVRNEPDGSVAVLLAGSGPAVSAMIDLLWEGPPGAAVSGVETREEAPDDLPAGFRVTG